MDQQIEKRKPFDGLDTFILRVTDVAGTGRWYKEVLGLEEIWTDMETGLIVLDSGNTISLTLWKTDQAPTVNNNITPFPIFKSSDILQSHAMLQSAGARVSEIKEDAFVRSFVFYDPEGNQLEACQVK